MTAPPRTICLLVLTPSSSPSVASPSESLASGTLPLKVVADIPLSGGTIRLYYLSLDSASGQLYIAHLGSDLMTVFDQVYWPLQNVGGKPVLRITVP